MTISKRLIQSAKDAGMTTEPKLVHPRVPLPMVPATNDIEVITRALDAACDYIKHMELQLAGHTDCTEIRQIKKARAAVAKIEKYVGVI